MNTLGNNDLRTGEIRSSADRQQALDVLSKVYCGEKAWVDDLDAFFPTSDLDRRTVSWFLAQLDGRGVGVTRVLYEIPFGLYRDYDFQLRDPHLGEFLRTHRVAEIGRFAVERECRKKVLVAAALMRAAATETVRRGYTHFITDVFENDPNSPYRFHRRVLGFEVVATHANGEMDTPSRRVTMLLDLAAAYKRMKPRNQWVFRYITKGWNEELLGRLAEKEAWTA